MEKKKRKNIFIVLFTVMITVMSLIAVSLYDNAKTQGVNRFKDIEYYYEDEFQLFTMNLAMQLDSTYQPFHFPASLPQEEQGYLQQQFHSMLDEVNNFVRNDRQFYYVAKNTKTGEVLTNLKNYSNETFQPLDYSYYIHISYDENGKCMLEGDLKEDIFSALDFDHYREMYAIENISDILVDTPKNIDIQYMLPKIITTYSGISGYANDWTHYSTFSCMLLMIFTCALAFFILVYPIRYVAQSKPFALVKEWPFEINLAVWTSIACLLFVGIITLAGNSVNGLLPSLLSDYGIGMSQQLVMGFNFFVWLISLLAIAIICFLLKWLIVCGPWKYIKEHSLIIGFFRSCKRKLYALSEIDLTSSMDKTILKYAALNGLIIVLIAVWHISVAILLAMLYSFALFLVAKKRMVQLQADYNTLLSSIQHIISEDFDKISEQDFGVFEASKSELNQLSENFKIAIQEKVKSQKLKTELISNVSHDLKTPLTCIKNYIALLKDDELSLENRHHYLEQLVLYTNRLKNLIDDLFEISKVDSGNITLKKQELDIVALLDQAYMQNEDLLEPKHLQIMKKYSSDKILLELDSDKTYRIFENLFTNIGKYALSNSRVYLTVNESAEAVEIEFSNISEVAMDFSAEEITERFVRGDKSRSKQGSGLGLAIARSFSEAQGANFKITIDCDLFKVRIVFPKDS